MFLSDEINNEKFSETLAYLSLVGLIVGEKVGSLPTNVCIGLVFSLIFERGKFRFYGFFLFRKFK